MGNYEITWKHWKKTAITTDKNGKNLSQLKIIEALLVYSRVFNNDYKLISRVQFTLIDLCLLYHLVNYLRRRQQILYCKHIWFGISGLFLDK